MFEIPVRHFARYYEIISILIRHGLGYVLISGNLIPIQEGNLAPVGVHLRNAFVELGPVFIKLGQLASTCSGFLPQPIIQELGKLHDRMRPLSFGDVRKVMEEALQTRLESAFQEFDPKPLAAASIAQTHLAVLHTGERVLVKVQRPFIRDIVKTDLEILRNMIPQIEQKTEWGKGYPIRMLFEAFARSIQGELDFHNEGRNAEKLAKSSQRHSDILIPKIYWEYSRPSVLTSEYIPGTPLHQIIGSMETSYNGHRIADQLSKVLIRQILLEGCFHGDPHPGNILVLPGEKIAFVDFGIIGNLSRTMRHQFVSLITAFIRGHDEQIIKIVSQMGIVSEHVDRLSLKRDILALRHKHFQVRKEKISIGEYIPDVLDIFFRHGIQIPSEFVLVGKSLLALEGILNACDPALSLVEQAKLLRRWLIKEKVSQYFFASKRLG